MRNTPWSEYYVLGPANTSPRSILWPAARGFNPFLISRSLEAENSGAYSLGNPQGFDSFLPWGLIFPLLQAAYRLWSNL